MRFLILFTLVGLTACQHLPWKNSLELGIKLTGAPSYEEAKAWRKDAGYRQIDSDSWVLPPRVTNGVQEPARVLINGDVVPRDEYPFALLIRGGGGCTASLVGERAVLTAAHCVDNGKEITFSVGGDAYRASCTHHPEYGSADHDMALCYVNKAVSGVKPVDVIVEHTAKKNMRVMILGYGCTQPGGEGGNDGKLRRGYSRIQAGQERDLVLYGDSPDDAALCFGDSGGPVLVEINGKWKQIADNSKGNIKDKSWVTRTDRWAKDFIVGWANKNNTYVCGANRDCGAGGGGEEPGPGEPRQFFFEDGNVTIQGLIKK